MIPREQRSALGLVRQDVTRRMTGRVDHLQLEVLEGNPLATANELIDAGRPASWRLVPKPGAQLLGLTIYYLRRNTVLTWI